MLNLKERISKNPFKTYFFVLFAITLFFIGFFLITFIISAKPSISTLTYYFNTTNVSTTFNFFNNNEAINNQIQICYNNVSVNCTTNAPTNSKTYNFDSISTIIAILGSFGVLTYIFYSIKEGSFADGDEKKIEYGFTGGFAVIFFLMIVVMLSLFYNLFPFDKLWEIVILTIILFFTLCIAVVFNGVFNEFESNYQNRQKLIKFLEIQETQPIISHNWDNLCRWIIAMKESISLYIFLLIIFLPIFGYLTGLNILSIVFLEFVFFILFGGFIRLVSVFENNCNIEIKNPFDNYEGSLRVMSNVFILYNSKDGYLEILTADNKKIRLPKLLVYSIQYNEITVFKGKEKLPPVRLITKRLIRLLLSLFITVVVYPFIILNVLQSKDLTTWILVVTGSVIFSFCLVRLLRVTIDRYIDKMYYDFLLSTTIF